MVQSEEDPGLRGLAVKFPGRERGAYRESTGKLSPGWWQTQWASRCRAQTWAIRKAGRYGTANHPRPLGKGKGRSRRARAVQGGGHGRQGECLRLWRGFPGAVGEDRWKGCRASGRGSHSGSDLSVIPSLRDFRKYGQPESWRPLLCPGAGVTRISMEHETGGPQKHVGEFALLVSARGLPSLTIMASLQYSWHIVDAQ